MAITTPSLSAVRMMTLLQEQALSAHSFVLEVHVAPVFWQIVQEPGGRRPPPDDFQTPTIGLYGIPLNSHSGALRLGHVLAINPSKNHLAAIMASRISYDGPNSGFQGGIIHGNVTAQFLQSETSLNQACLRDLRTTNPHHDKDRIQNTNGGLLKDSYRWILDNEEFQQWQNNQSNCLLWIRGDPGKGKTMLLCGIIDELTRLFEDTANISFFFCQATDMRINNATAVLRGLIYSLVKKQPSLLSHVKSQYDHAGKALFEDINAWNALSRIFTDILKDATLQSTYLIIDALDECTTGLPSLLNLITQVSSAYPQSKWIVSSRNWPDIKERLDTTYTAPISLELNEASVSEAVSKFIQHKVHYLAKVKKYSDETRDTICRHLSSNSQGTFLWVALVCQDLDRTSRRHSLKKLEAFPPGLNALYGRMIDQVHNSEDAEPCKRILAVMSIVYQPIAFDELPCLVELPNVLSDDSEALSEIIAICGSFLTMREGTIIFVHQSAKEFLLRERRNGVFPGGVEAEHSTIFSRSLQTIFKTLRRDIFQLKFPGFPIEKVIPPNPNPLAAAKYACVYWVYHLHHSGFHEKNDLGVDERGWVDDFLQKKYLHWLEALSILGSLPQGIAAMLKLEALLQGKGEPHILLYRVQDASRFIRYNRLAIESSPLQVYYSPLIFSPMLSLTRKCYQRERPKWVLNEPLVEKDWSACLQNLEGHSSTVNTIAWSRDGSQLASASNDKTVRVWDPATGECTLILEGHSRPVRSIAWSPDGSRLASGSSDETVRIWNPATGQCALTLEGHSSLVLSTAWSRDRSRLVLTSDDRNVSVWDPTTGECVLTLDKHRDSVNSIAWSQDGSRFASGSSNNTVRIWDPATGQCTSTLEGHNDSVYSIAWSRDGSRLASASRDMTVRIWDPVTSECTLSLVYKTSVHSIAWSQDGNRLAIVLDDRSATVWHRASGQCVSTLDKHRDSVNSIAWSQDGSRLVSATDDQSVRVWELATGQCVLTLDGHRDSVNSIDWSRDGSRLASASRDRTIRIWDPATGECTLILEGHSRPVRSIAWSPDGSRLASSSDDKTIGIWDLATGQCISTLEGYSNSIFSVAWSQDGSRLASASSDKTVRIWDPATGQYASTLEGHRDSVNSIAWSRDRSRLASASRDMTVRIWDPATGQCTSTLQGHASSVYSIAWSYDGSRLASGSNDETVMIWDPATGECTLILEGHNDPVHSITWSQDGTRLASASEGETVMIWDPATGECISTLKGHYSSVYSIAWSQDGSRLASSGGETVMIWDPVTGECILTLEGHDDSVYSIAWSQDESRLASASEDETVMIWDPVTGECILTLEGHDESVHSIAWSQDGSRLASASNDQTVRIWDAVAGQCESILHISSLDFLEFDKVNFNYLHTSIGTFDIGFTSTVTSTPLCSTLPQQHGYGLNNDHSWITRNGVNILWLPADYRPKYSSLFAISATYLVIACSSGLVIFLALTEKSSFPGL